jgi:uncharacterized protein DUF1905
MFQQGNNTGIEVSADIVAALVAGKRPAVVVNVNGYEYRSTVAPMGGRYLLPFSAERGNESTSGGSASAAASWDKLSYTYRKEAERSVLEARKPTPGHVRIQAVVAKLED